MNTDLTVDKAEYSAEDTMTAERLCYLLMISPPGQIIARVAPAAAELFFESFSEAQLREIKEHLYSYTEKILLTEADGRIWGIIPTLYPSSSLYVALVSDESLMSGTDLLRLATDDEFKDAFVLSESISTCPSRITERFPKQKARFKVFFDDIISALLKLSSLECADVGFARDELYRRIYAVSRLTVCSVDVVEENGSEGDYRKTDLPLLSAFLFNFLAFAKERAPLRQASVRLASLALAATVTVCFDTQSPIAFSEALVEWEGLAADRNMMFGYASRNDHAEITFQPLRRDWSYLGLKQRTDFFE